MEILAALADQGLRTARIDYSDPATLQGLFAGAEALLLVSGNEPGKRIDQHRNAIEAAVAAGVGRIVYTSAPRATTSTLVLAPEHKATEELIAASGLPSTILRNNWYHENQLPALELARNTGEVVASAGDGRIASRTRRRRGRHQTQEDSTEATCDEGVGLPRWGPSASRQDFADAAAVVLTEDRHIGKVYELSGDTAWDYTELAATIGDILGRSAVYRPVTPEEHREILLGAGLDEATAGFVVALDGNVRDGALAETSGELRALIGRPSTPLADGLRSAVRLGQVR